MNRKRRVPPPGRDLKSCNPLIAEEWYEDEEGLSPERVFPRCDKSVTWKCKKCGHIWNTKICTRTSSISSGCPCCAGRVLIPGKNDLASQRPDIAKEWLKEKRGLTPEQVFVHAGVKVTWKCKKCGHIWDTLISNRTGKASSGCPCCAGKVLVPGKNDLASQSPDIAKEWLKEKHGLSPEKVFAHADKEVTWKCSTCGHTWDALISSRTSKKPSGCPCCAGKILIPGKNDLASQRPDIAEEWYREEHGLTPEQVFAHARVKVTWKCKKCGHIWDLYVCDRTSTNHPRCPCCAGKVLIPGKNDLASRRPDIAADWDTDANNGLTPNRVFVYSVDYANWCCQSCGHKWLARICHRTQKNYPGMCSICRRIKK